MKLSTTNIIVIVVVVVALGGLITYYSLRSAPSNAVNLTNMQNNNSTNAAGNPTDAAVSDPNMTAQAGDLVSVNYTGKLADGTVFDSSSKQGKPISFVLGAGMVIPGWDKGIVGMKIGDKKTLVIPPADAYGANGIPNGQGGYIIPPNATLTFDVQLVDIKRKAAGN